MIFFLLYKLRYASALIKSKYAPQQLDFASDMLPSNASSCNAGIKHITYIFLDLDHNTDFVRMLLSFAQKCRPLGHTNIHKKMCNNLIDPFTCINADLKTIYPGQMSLYINVYIFIIVHFFNHIMSMLSMTTSDGAANFEHRRKAINQ